MTLSMSLILHQQGSKTLSFTYECAFWLVDESLNDKFVKESTEAGLLALEGHRIVGGMRASIYNAMPLEGVKALVDFMAAFAKENS